MDAALSVITINGKEYVEKSKQAQPTLGDGYVLVRTNSAGVFAGILKERKGKEGILLHSRRIWYWDGAASLSQLAVDGTNKPENCKFPCEIEGEHVLTEIVEVLQCTLKAQKSIKEVPIWKK